MKRHSSVFAFLLCAFVAVGLTGTANGASTLRTYYRTTGGEFKSCGDTDKTISPQTVNVPFRTNPTTFTATLGEGEKVEEWWYYTASPVTDRTAEKNAFAGTGNSVSLSNTDDSRPCWYLVAHFAYIKYNLKYDYDGGSGTGSGSQNNLYTAAVILASTSEKTGYTFRKWKASSNGVEFDAGSSVTGTELGLANCHEDNSNVTMKAQWTEKMYGISTSGENCAVTVSKTSGVKYSETVTVSWDPQTPSGHSRRFKNAKVLAGETELASFSSGTTSGTFAMSAANKGYFENVTVKVVYEDTMSQYQVNVISSGNGSVSKDPNQSKYDFGSTVTISATPNDGYAFASWSDGGAQTHDVQVAAADATYTATFTNRVYTLTWNANGGTFADGSSVSNVLIAYGSPLGTLPLPDRYRFARDGWHTEESGGTVVDSDTRYTWNYDRTLYMHWQESHLYKIRTVASPEEGGTTEGGGDLATGETTTLKATPNEGYSFKSWSDGGAQTHDVTVGLEDVTYTATFTGSTYKVYFKLEDASGEEYDGDKPKAIERSYGNVYGELPPPTLYDETLEFVCWTDEDGDEITPTTPVRGGDPAKKRIDLCVSVRRRLFYTVTFDGEAETSGSMAAQRIYRDEETALTSNAFKRTGYAFLGWAKTNDLKRVKYADGTNVLNIAKVGDTNELHAVWSANAYKVGFLPGGAKDTMPDQEFRYGEAKPLSKCKFDRVESDLWHFEGWTNSASGGRLYADEEIVSNLTDQVDGRVELTAVWSSMIGPLSEAMGCDNLKWIDGDVLEKNKGWERCETDGCDCAGHDGYPPCVMQLGGEGIWMHANIATNGTLSFWYRLSEASALIDVYVCPDNGIPIYVGSASGESGRWLHKAFGIPAPSSQTDPTQKYYIEIAHWNSGNVFIDQMTWTPEGLPPGPGDAVKISSAAVSDGKFILSFKSDDRFDYNLLTNGNLLIKSWGILDTFVGDGSEHTFEPAIRADQPQLFYRVDTIQRK